MDPTDSFSQKKKKDLVAIATLFGILSEEKANRMTKPELIDYLQDQDRKSRETTAPVRKSPVKPAAKSSVDEVLLMSTHSMIEAINEPRSEIPVTAARHSVKKAAVPVVEDAILPVIPATAGKSTKKTIRIPTPGTAAEPVTEPVAALVSEPPYEPEFSGNSIAIMDDGSIAAEALIIDTVYEEKTKRRGRPKKDLDAAPAAPVTIADAAAEPAMESNAAADVTEPVVVEPVETAEAPFEVGSHDMPTENASSRKSSFDTGHRTGRSKRRSITIKPKDEDYMSDPMSSEAYDAPYDENDEPESRHTQRKEHRFTADEGEDQESGENAESVHHARMLRPKEQPQEMLSGVLEIMSEGYGFLRRENYLQGLNDIYVPAPYIRRFGLRVGDFVMGPCRPKRDADRFQAIQYIKEVNGLPPEKMMRRVHFDRLTPIYPDEPFVLETDKNELSTRIIDLVAPIGKGQRGMIVSPPKAGKTILLQKIANSISINNPDCKLIVLLIDERPEEVTDMQRSINGEVVYSTFDKTPENHVRIVELVLERAMRLVELGQDVVILLDSITRLSRAYNLTINPTGRTLSGGLDPGALYGPKRFFGAARNIEGGGSLTIIATSLIETGSRMDEVIFEEFKGTGNMEVYLDRKLSEKRIFPAIDLNKSGTRREELLLTPVALDAVWTIRKAFSQLDTTAVTEMIISLLMKTATNNQFVQSINVSFNDKAVFDAMRGTRPAGTSNGGPAGANGK